MELLGFSISLVFVETLLRVINALPDYVRPRILRRLGLWSPFLLLSFTINEKEPSHLYGNRGSTADTRPRLARHDLDEAACRLLMQDKKKETCT